MSFNIRVYGILINDRNEVLLTDEFRFGKEITKFPGGGLIKGEGTIDCLKREFMEECSMHVEVKAHFYTTDFYQRSAFDDTQVISIYYLIEGKEPVCLETRERMDFSERRDGAQLFRWQALAGLEPEDLTFPIDSKVAGMLKENIANRI